MSRQIVDARFAEKVKALREEGKTQDQIAAELRIVQSTVSAILRRGGLGGRLISARSFGDESEGVGMADQPYSSS
jgi:predicted transcriptional regulator